MSGVKGRSGGARPGSGRKRASLARLHVLGSRQRQVNPTETAPARPNAGVAAPDCLPADERAVWDRLAPLAVGRGTLTAAEVDAFADLCETIVVMQEMLRTIRADGLMQNRLSTKMDVDGGGEQVFESKAHPLIQKWTALKVRVEAGKARFLLTGTGKPIASESTEAPVSALGKLQQQAHQMRRAT